MARFQFDPHRVNYSVTASGREYNLRLLQRAQPIFTQLLNLLPSNYISAVQGPNYSNELKAVAVELARLELALEDVDRDRCFETTRPEFLYSIVGYFLLLNGRVPQMEFSDVAFRDLLINLIRIYFQGSVPESMTDVMKLLLSGNVQLTENFLLIRRNTGAYDISDQFGFDLAIETGGVFPPDVFSKDQLVRQLLNILRPAHTLYRLRFVFRDEYIPTYGEVLDAMRWHLASYYYDDFRAYCGGVRDLDRLGRKVNQQVVAEDHSADF